MSVHVLLKGASVLVNIYSVNSDESHWKDPSVFRPERHLNAEGTGIVKSHLLMPFGVGNKSWL